jgi:hypothetical protein
MSPCERGGEGFWNVGLGAGGTLGGVWFASLALLIRSENGEGRRGIAVLLNQECGHPAEGRGDMKMSDRTNRCRLAWVGRLGVLEVVGRGESW